MTNLASLENTNLSAKTALQLGRLSNEDAKLALHLLGLKKDLALEVIPEPTSFENPFSWDVTPEELELLRYLTEPLEDGSVPKITISIGCVTNSESGEIEHGLLARLTDDTENRAILLAPTQDNATAGLKSARVISTSASEETKNLLIYAKEEDMEFLKNAVVIDRSDYLSDES